MLTKYFCVFLLGLGCFCDDEENPLVETPLGTVRGYLGISFEGRKFSSFEGIPFAKPPIGERRFKEPEAIEPWDGVWDAGHLSDCPQSDLFQSKFRIKVKGSEDCLYVNVYVPRENPNPKEKLDVVVNIHGGAYMVGSGGMFNRPDYIMDKDLILVTFNYRLGILGFLSTEDEVVPGNNGMKDQVMALEWVQKNIPSFGGDPSSVTLTGQSAGGASVHLHYFSELSKGLFHRGLSQSGVALNPWSLQNGALKKAKMVAGGLGCPTSSSQDLLECLQQKPYRILLEQQSMLYSYKMLPLAPFAPVVEKAGTKPFLSADPFSLLMKGQVRDVPWVASNTKDEGYVPMILSPDDLENFNDNWNKLAPALLDFDHTLDELAWAAVSRKIRDFYFEKSRINAGTVDKLVRLIGERTFTVDAETAVRLQAKATDSSVYYYVLTYPGENNEAKIVGHGQDAVYYYTNAFGTKQLDENELKMKEIFLNLLVSYASTGIPLVEGIEWKPTQYDQLTYLNISSFIPAEMSLTSVEELTPRKFWTSLGFAENENLMVAKDEL